MFKNYLSVAFRNLFKHKVYSFINIIGLTVGITCFVLIFLFVKDELSYDSYHADINNIYRMDFEGSLNGEEFIIALAGAPSGAAMVNDYPEVIDALRFRQRGRYLIKRKDSEENIDERSITFVDKNFFDFFSINLIKGDSKTVLDAPNKLALSEDAAKKYFGNEDPIGQTLTLDNRTDYQVTGIYENIPSNTHFHFDVLLSMETLEESKQKIWLSFNFNTYLKLKEGTNPEELQAKFVTILDKYLGPEFKRFMNITMEEFHEAGNKGVFSLFPMKDIHLYSDKDGELEPNGDIKYVIIFSVIAVFILIIACINYMNLATARSSNRAKEVGIRKVLGAYKPQLVRQFLSEAVLLSLLAVVISIFFSMVLLPYFNDLSSKNLAVTALIDPVFMSSIVALILLVGVLAGSYPAFFLASFRPVEVLKGKLNLGLKNGGLRSVLVVFQFTLSILMMVGTAVVFDQLNYIQNKKLGFNKDRVILLHDAWVMGKKLDAFKIEALRNTNIEKGTITSYLPVGTSDNNTVFFPGLEPSSENTFVMNNWRVDHDYIPTLGMEMLSGRNFSRDFKSDSSAIIINEVAATQFGFEEPLGKTISTFGGDSPDDVVVEPFKIIGVVKNFHFASLRENIAPLVMYLGKSRGFISFKIKSNDLDQTVKDLEGYWNEFAPGQPFTYSFLDQRFDAIYAGEQQIGKIFSVFAFLAIFIACLGMFGLASFTTDQRTKEIGIRKVLGSSTSKIVALLSREFVKLVMISFIIASPIAYYFMNMWLNDFVYRAQLSVTSFILSGFLSLIIAISTMSYQSIRAARSNPVNSLRDE